MMSKSLLQVINLKSLRPCGASFMCAAKAMMKHSAIMLQDGITNPLH